MKKTILKRVIFVLLFLLQMVQGYAQAYEFECEENNGFWSCSLKQRLEFQKDVELLFYISAARGLGSVVRFAIIDTREGLHNFQTFGFESTSPVVFMLHLSDGEILQNSECVSHTIFYDNGTQHFTSNKKNFTSPLETISYIMSRLRKVNIVKISVNGKNLATPNFRSAATIDAMCKKLITKTGDQGQYGTAPTGSSATSKKTTTNRSSSSSSSNYSSSAGGTYTIQKGDVLWNVSKKLLKESGKANPTNGEIMQAMKDIAKANGCKTYDECNNKYFNSRNVGKYIKLPGYLTKTSVKTSDSSSTTSTATSKPSTSSSSSTSTTTTPSSSSTTTTTPSSSSSTYSSGNTYGGTSSRPSYNYSYKYREPHKWIGFSIGYVQKQWTSKVDGKRERYGMWEDSKFISGVQAGIRIEPVASFGLGLNTGLFYEYYYTQSKDMYYSDASGSYRGVIQEHALYLPVHLEYRLRITDDFHAFIYGGAGLDYGISAGVEMKDTNDDYVVYENGTLYESDDVENWKRFNASLEYGLGLSYKNVQLNVTRSHGLINMAKDSDNSVKQDKPLMVSLSVMF